MQSNYLTIPMDKKTDFLKRSISTDPAPMSDFSLFYKTLMLLFLKKEPTILMIALEQKKNAF